MIKTLILSLVIPLHFFGQQKDRSFSFEGKIKDMPCKAATFFLQYRAGGVKFTDSVNSSDGKYMFTGNIGTSSLARLWVKYHPDTDSSFLHFVEERDLVAFFLKPGKTKAVSVDSFSNISLSGAVTSLALHTRGNKLPQKNGKEKVYVGSQAPDFSLPDTAGQKISLSSFRGKYVLVEFWASWCAPCKPENEQLVLINNRFRDKNFQIVAISLDGEEYENQWRKTIRRDNLTWTHLSNQHFSQNGVTDDYGISFLPQNFLIDPAGKIIDKNLSPEGLLEKLSMLLK